MHEPTHRSATGGPESRLRPVGVQSPLEGRQIAHGQVEFEVREIALVGNVAGGLVNPISARLDDTGHCRKYHRRSVVRRRPACEKVEHSNETERG